MKKQFLLLAICAAGISNAQNVGINTSSPTNTLDVNGTARVRSVATVAQPDYYASYDANGVLQKAKAQRIVASGVDTSTGPIDVAVGQTAVINSYTDLGLALNLSVPAGKKYGVNVFYSVPMGTVVGTYSPGDLWTETVSVITNAGSNPIAYTNTTYSRQTNLGGYFGVGFFRNGTLLPEPTRKVTIPTRSGNSVQMTTINAEYTEVLDNTAGTSALPVSYSLQGYIEHNFSSPVSAGEAGATVRFNMYSLTEPNYNWGRATISYILYELQ